MLLRLAAKGRVQIFDLSEISEDTAKQAFLDETGIPHEFSSAYRFDVTTIRELKIWAELGSAGGVKTIIKSQLERGSYEYPRTQNEINPEIRRPKK